MSVENDGTRAEKAWGDSLTKLRCTRLTVTGLVAVGAHAVVMPIDITISVGSTRMEIHERLTKISEKIKQQNFSKVAQAVRHFSLP